MTDAELVNFINTENIVINDVLRLDYNYGIIPQTLIGKLLNTILVKGGVLIKTQYGNLSLPNSSKFYLVLYNPNNGVFGVTAEHINRIELESYASYDISRFNKFIHENSVQPNDTLIFIMVDNGILKGKIVVTNIVIDEDGDELIITEFEDGIEEVLLNSVGKLQKA